MLLGRRPLILISLTARPFFFCSIKVSISAALYGAACPRVADFDLGPLRVALRGFETISKLSLKRSKYCFLRASASLILMSWALRIAALACLAATSRSACFLRKSSNPGRVASAWCGARTGAGFLGATLLAGLETAFDLATLTVVVGLELSLRRFSFWGSWFRNFSFSHVG